MRYEKISIIAFNLLFLCIFSLPIFDICKASCQAAQGPAIEEAGARVKCLLGKKINNFPFYVYKDADSGKENFFPTGNMGDLSGSEINTHCKDSPYAGSSCIKVVYKVKSSQIHGWAGLYWQYPPNNWGNIPEAYDLTGATKLTFWARGQNGTEVINRFQVGGITGKYRDLGAASIGRITLAKEWKQYTISLKNMDKSIIVNYEDKKCWPLMEPLSRIIGGFCWATSPKVKNNHSIIFYLDEIRFENN